MSEAEGTDLLEPISDIQATTQPLSPTELLALPVGELTIDQIHSSLIPLTNSEAIDTCISLIGRGDNDNINLLRGIIDEGLSRGESDFRSFEEEVKDLLRKENGGENETVNLEPTPSATEQVVGNDEVQRDFVRNCSLLLEYRNRLETYILFAPSSEAGPSSPPTIPEKRRNTDIDIDDPWAENDGDGDGEDTTELDDPWESSSVKSTKSTKSAAGRTGESPATATPDEVPPLPITSFLSSPLPDSASFTASSAALNALKIVYERHTAELWPYRYAILDSLPSWISPTDIQEVGILPRLGQDGLEPPQPDTAQAISEVVLATLSPQTTSSREPDRQNADWLKNWYTSKVNSLDTLGLLDLQLAWVQHGAALGVPGLDALGEDLSLLARLVYDAHLTPAQQSDWSLSSWREASTSAIIKAYLSNATRESIVGDIRRLVLPYLYVLESRAERAGEDSKDLVEIQLHDIILGLPLHLVLPIFEASKATTPTPERTIKNDLTVARLALACLYGSNTRDAWSIMSAIFECLPVWDVSGGDPESDKEATSTTLESIAMFVRPTRAGAHPPTAKDLFIFFNPLPFASLSRALDILDVHLENGEILARWDTPVQLRFLLQSARDKSEQKELAEKMVRRQVNNGSMTEPKWITLWGDMRKLNGGGDALLRGAFGVLSIEEMLEIYLGGVLASGKFDIARRIVKRLEPEVEGGIPEPMLEKVVLATSREFYENAESGNMHTGEMKLAYDCLAVAPVSTAITREKEFIEATSRLSTFSLASPSGSGTLSPIEIRHSKSKLDLISRVLQSSDDAYRHPDLIIELSGKLGFRDGQSKVRVIAMLSASAQRNEDYETAYTHCQEIFKLPPKYDTDGVVWKELLSLGAQTEYHDIAKRMTLLGQAAERCPADQVPVVLAQWRTVESGQIKLTEAAKRRRVTGVKSDGVSSKRSSVISNASAPEERVLGSRTAARAARLAMGFAGDRFNLKGIASAAHLSSPTISGGGTPHLGDTKEGSEWGRSSGEGDRPSFGAMFEGAGVKAGTAEAERVRQQARKALVRGVGWLLGADEKELEGE